MFFYIGDIDKVLTNICVLKFVESKTERCIQFMVQQDSVAALFCVLARRLELDWYCVQPKATTGNNNKKPKNYFYVLQVVARRIGADVPVESVRQDKRLCGTRYYYGLSFKE